MFCFFFEKNKAQKPFGLVNFAVVFYSGGSISNYPGKSPNPNHYISIQNSNIYILEPFIIF